MPLIRQQQLPAATELGNLPATWQWPKHSSDKDAGQRFGCQHAHNSISECQV
jgi:hypothetical protein